MTISAISPPAPYYGIGFLHLVKNMLVSLFAYGNVDKKGTEAMFERIVEDNKPLINKICYYYASSRQEYEDLCQDVVINIWKSLSTFKAQSLDSTWIYRICLNTCITSWRRNRRHKDNIPLDNVDNRADDDIAAHDNMEQLHYLISLLSPTEKALIMLWLDEKSYEEISEVTGYNRNTVATKLRRIKEKMVRNAKSGKL